MLMKNLIKILFVIIVANLLLANNIFAADLATEVKEKADIHDVPEVDVPGAKAPVLEKNHDTGQMNKIFNDQEKSNSIPKIEDIKNIAIDKKQLVDTPEKEKKKKETNSTKQEMVGDHNDISGQNELDQFANKIDKDPLYKNTRIKIAAGNLLGGYYNIGLRVCRYISNSNDGVRCEVVPTSGSIENIELLRSGKVDFAFSLSSVAVDAYNAKDVFADREEFKQLRQILRLNPEIFTVLVRKDSNISMFEDLAGKKISNGSKYSDSTSIYNELMHYYKFSQPVEDIDILHQEYAKSLCEGDVDAIMMVTGHPNALVNLITHNCPCDSVQISEEKINALLGAHPGFYRSNLNKNIYPNIDNNQLAIAADAILLVSDKTNKMLVSNFLNYFDLRIARFKASDPALYKLDDEHFRTGFVLPKFNDE